MNSKTNKVTEWTKHLQGRLQDAHYLGYFECFNRQEYFVAHEVLEALWLPQRNGPKGDFYKGLIQLAGAFVHIQKRRRGPALALFRLAERNLLAYGPAYEGLDTQCVLGMIHEWVERIENEPALPHLTPASAPQLSIKNPS